MKFKNITLFRDLLLVSISLVSLGKVALKIMEILLGIYRNILLAE